MKKNDCIELEENYPTDPKKFLIKCQLNIRNKFLKDLNTQELLSSTLKDQKNL